MNTDAINSTKLMKTSLFGLNKAAVHRQLASIRKMQNDELDDLNLQIKKLKAQNNRILNELHQANVNEIEEINEIEETNELEENLTSFEEITVVEQTKDNSMLGKESNVLQFKKKESPLVVNEEQQATADGLIARETNSPAVISAITPIISSHEEPAAVEITLMAAQTISSVQSAPIPIIEKNLAAAYEQTTAINANLMVVGLGFWGDIVKYIEWDSTAAQQPVKNRPVNKHENKIREAITVNQQETAAALEKTEIKDHRIEQEINQHIEISPEQLPNPAKSQAITEEILSIRQRYIVGKKAGEDILDRNGQLIIAKNSTITAEVVEKADEEGKLPDLIIHMIITGLGD